MLPFHTVNLEVCTLQSRALEHRVTRYPGSSPSFLIVRGSHAVRASKQARACLLAVREEAGSHAGVFCGKKGRRSERAPRMSK